MTNTEEEEGKVKKTFSFLCGLLYSLQWLYRWVDGQI